MRINMKVDNVNLNSVKEDADIKICSRWKKIQIDETFFVFIQW
jgi:hypothetical protein